MLAQLIFEILIAFGYEVFVIDAAYEVFIAFFELSETHVLWLKVDVE